MNKRRARRTQDLVILQAALVCEGLLLVTAFIFSVLFDIPLYAEFEIPLIGLGLIAAFPLIGGNIAFSQFASARPAKFPTFNRFLKELIEPLCQELPVSAAFVVAMLSGVCEELFFRGVLQTFLSEFLGLVPAIVIINGFFAVIHFVGRLRDFWKLIPFYFFCGVYFSVLTYATADLTASIVAHGLNNFIAVLYVRRLMASRKVLKGVGEG